jgi:hypothetical protein
MLYIYSLVLSKSLSLTGHRAFGLLYSSGAENKVCESRFTSYLFKLSCGCLNLQNWNAVNKA